MIYNFCTLFDSNYLTKGLALYHCLEKYCENFHLFIFAFDEIAYNVLKQLKLSKATIISLKEFEDEELLKVKPTRTKGEYCWTATSSTILYILKKYNVESCTYIDADIFFYSSPKPIFDEIGNDSILITEHRYSPEYNKEIKSGKYCVQFITFKNNENGLKALRWWRERCIEWCYNRFEDGKFGDQLYLDDWTERFEGVYVMKHPGGGLAAWNIQQYEFEKKNNKIIVIEKSTGQRFEVIFYHFHYLRFYKNNIVELGRRKLSKNVLDIFYKPYIKYLDELKKQVHAIDSSFDPHGTLSRPFSVKNIILYIYRKLRGTYNVFNKNKLLES
ncbi:MAG: glycosyl transferase [Ignavibacteria bacterium RBG_16_34_14]|nr:MAG: glycosyl transferase [Ignavibacteria bacterium RBG_16_34_14]